MIRPKSFRIRFKRRRIRHPPPPPEKLDPEDEARLDAMLEEGLAELDRGEFVTAEEVLARLREPLDAALEEALARMDRGEPGIPAEEFLAALRARR